MLVANAIAPLSDVFQISAGIGAMIGGIAGFAVRATSDRRMLENVALGTAIGAVVATFLGFALWVGSLPA